MTLKKGRYGYLKNQRKKEIIKTILYFSLSAAIFAMGYYSTKTKVNLLTVVAVLGCLPASKSAVSMIMYLRAGSCSDACYQAVRTYEKETLLLYDLYLTSYRRNFQISAVAVKNNTICGYTEDGKCDLSAGEKHITEILQQSGYNALTVKLFSDFSKFAERVDQINALPEKNAEREESIAQVLRDISL